MRSMSAHTAWLRAEDMWPGEEQLVGQEEASSNPAFCAQHCSEQVLRFTNICLKAKHQPNAGLTPMSVASVMGLGALRGGRYLRDTQTPLLVSANCTCRLQGDLTTRWEHCFCCDAKEQGWYVPILQVSCCKPNFCVSSYAFPSSLRYRCRCFWGVFFKATYIIWSVNDCSGTSSCP